MRCRALKSLGSAAPSSWSRYARPRLETPNTTDQIPTSHTSEISPSPGKAMSSAPNTIDATPPSAIQNSPSSSRRRAMAAMTWNVPVAIAQKATR